MKHTSAPLQLDDVGFVQVEPCPECDAAPGAEHASWCLHEEVEVEVDEG